MKTKLLALLMISSLALTACAFDDDDNTPKSQQSLKENDKKDENKKDENKKDENKKDENKKDDPKPDTPFTMEQQSATWTVKTDSEGEPVSVVSMTPKYEKSNGDGDGYKTIVINNKTITFKETRGSKVDDENLRRVSQEEENSNSFWEYQVAPSDPSITSRGTAYARYGYTVDIQGTTANMKMFYQGQPTTDMPTKGSATYKGFAIAIDPSKTVATKGEADSFYALSEFKADFGGKTLSGTLSDWKAKNSQKAIGQLPNAVQIEATISANTFKGTANGTGTAEGKFYGPKAQNLAGAFNDKSQNLQGVFGGNKQ